MKRALSRFLVGLAVAAAGPALGSSALADEEMRIQLSLKAHKFDPAEPTAPAGKPIVIEVSNQDPTPAEFESKALRVEKVVAGGGAITVHVRPLPPGRYRFYDDYHEKTTEGFLVVK